MFGMSHSRVKRFMHTQFPQQITSTARGIEHDLLHAKLPPRNYLLLVPYMVHFKFGNIQQDERAHNHSPCASEPILVLWTDVCHGVATRSVKQDVDLPRKGDPFRSRCPKGQPNASGCAQ